MSMSNATENATLKMHLQGTDPSYRAGATQYLALVTDAAGGQAGALLAGAQPGGVGQQNIFLSQSVITTRQAESYTASIQGSSQTLSVERARQIFTSDPATTAETWAAEESTSVFRKTP